MGLISPSMLSSYSIASILSSNTPIILMAAGEIIVMIAGSIDLSLAASVGFSSVLAAGLMSKSGLPVVFTIIIVLLIGAFIGFANGIIVGKGKLQSFIVTLGSSVVIRGITLVYSAGTSIPLAQSGLTFINIATHQILGLPIYFWVGIIVIILTSLYILKTKYGRHLYALGGSELAARVAGLKADVLRIKAFTLAGLFYALSGLALLAKFGSGWPQAASGWEMDGIAASVLGGANFAGGVGLPLGAIPGAIVLDLIMRFLVTLGIDPYWQYTAKGIFVIVIALTLARGEYGR
ncbi:MAG: ABC transporter permease [Nitrososphaerota archaeon]